MIKFNFIILLHLQFLVFVLCPTICELFLLFVFPINVNDVYTFVLNIIVFSSINIHINLF